MFGVILPRTPGCTLRHAAHMQCMAIVHHTLGHFLLVPSVLGVNAGDHMANLDPSLLASEAAFTRLPVAQTGRHDAAVATLG
jgi:hypothetical protein